MGTRRIQTPIFRASHVALLEPKQNKNGTWLYQVTMIFEPDQDLSEMKAIFGEAIAERWPSGPPKTGVRSPFRQGKWKSEAYPQGFDLDKYPEYEGKIIVSASSYTEKLPNGSFPKNKKPGVVGPDPQAIFDPERDPIYSGMYGRAEISAYVPKNKEALDGVSFGLHNFQKCKDGDSLGGANNGDPTKVFSTFEEPVGVGAHDDLLGI